MFGYFVRYFIARASYDAMRASVRHRAGRVSRAQAQENLRQANERLRLARANLAALRAPILDDNLLAIGKRHALLGMKRREVEACYGEGEDLPSPSKGVALRGYRLNAFSLCVSFWKDRSFQESWTKAGPEKPWQANEILALLENKTPGHKWSPLKSSSQQLNWWASPLGLVGCFEIRESGHALLHIADPKHGAPSTLPALPAAALPAPLPATEPPAKPRNLGCIIVGSLVALFVLYSLVHSDKVAPTNSASTSPAYTPSSDSTPLPPHALPVTPPSVRAAIAVIESTPLPSPTRPLATGTVATEHTYSVVNIANGDTLNVHSGPGSKFSSVAKLLRGTNNIHVVGASVMNDTTEWVHISFGNRSGWVSKQYLRAD